MDDLSLAEHGDLVGDGEGGAQVLLDEKDGQALVAEAGQQAGDPGDHGRVSARTGTPVAATLAGGLVATVTTLAAFAMAGDDNSRYFSLALTPSISLPALATGWSALALAAAVWPGLGTANPDAHLPDGFVGQRLVFTVAELVPLGLVPPAGFLLARTRRSPAR